MAGDIREIIASFNCISAYKELTRSRCKPWDDRELDALEGFKLIAFIMTCASNAVYIFFFTQL